MTAAEYRAQKLKPPGNGWAHPARVLLLKFLVEEGRVRIGNHCDRAVSDDSDSTANASDSEFFPLFRVDPLLFSVKPLP